MSEHFNRLDAAEDERLALLMEECGEVVQIIGKIMRHGYDSCHPDGGPTNREALERECGDVHHAMERLCESGDIRLHKILGYSATKSVSVTRYLHHQNPALPEKTK